MSQGILKYFNPSLILTRNLNKRHFKWYGEGIKYPGFTYYPRYENFQDPPCTPTKLFKVNRIKPLKGVPYYEKNILKEFKLDGKTSEYAIIKNIPENNQRLWKIKHLIEIVPITYPDGEPQPGDRTYLKENGELKIVRKLNVPVEKRLELTEDFQKNVKKMDGDTLRRQPRSVFAVPKFTIFGHPSRSFSHCTHSRQ